MIRFRDFGLLGASSSGMVANARLSQPVVVTGCSFSWTAFSGRPVFSSAERELSDFIFEDVRLLPEIGGGSLPKEDGWGSLDSFDLISQL